MLLSFFSEETLWALRFLEGEFAHCHAEGPQGLLKAGTTSPYSLYSESLASFTTGDLYDHHDAEGFITLFGLPLKVRAMKLAESDK